MPQGVQLANDLGTRLDATNNKLAQLQTQTIELQRERDTLKIEVEKRDKLIATLEAKVDLLIKLYGRDPFEGGKPGTGPLGKGA